MERKKKNYQRLLSIILALALIAGTFSGIGSRVYAEEDYTYGFTVCDGRNISSYFPFYSEYADNYQKVQYIIPAEDMVGLTGSTITGLKYYLRKNSAKKKPSTFKVYLKEVDSSVFTEYAFISIDDAALFYEGQLDTTGEIMEVICNKDTYVYNGGNLLVSFFVTGPEDGCIASFYGMYKENASVMNYISCDEGNLNDISYGYNGFPGFIPKTTFIYRSDHAHQYTYAADESGINVYCSNDNCSFNNYPMTKIALQAPDRYTEVGVESPDVRITGDIPEGTDYSITYKMGEEVLDEASTAAGTYTATLTIGEAATNLKYTIAEGLKLYDGTDFIYNIPINGTEVGYYQKVQFIMPAEDVTGLMGKVIKGLRFFTFSPAKDACLDTTFQIYLSEVDNSSFDDDSFIDVDEALLVYEGSLDATGSTMDVIFNKGMYEYAGKNLLVSIFVTRPDDKGYDYSAFYYGKRVNHSSIIGIGSDSLVKISTGAQCNFLPKTEFIISPAREHDLYFTADGATIYASCSDEDCYYNIAPEILTLKAPQYLFEGCQESAEAIVEGKIRGVDNPKVVYKKGDTILDEAPTKPGRYTASITIEDATASVSYVIAEPLTVNDGTNINRYCPIYGYYLYNYQKAQLILSAEELTDMKDQNVYGMSFYISQPVSKKWNTDFKIYLKETEESCFSDDRAYLSIEDAELVYSGKLDATNPDSTNIEEISSREESNDCKKIMNIRFDNSYEYKGGNLLVTIYNVTKRDCSSTFFYGVDQNTQIVSICNHNSEFDKLTNRNSSYGNFLPKTTFSYLPDAPVITAEPADTKVIRGSKAKFSVKAEGKGLTYKWQNSVDGETWTDSKATGYNTDTISFKATDKLDGRYFRCIVSNAADNVYSETVKLTTLSVVSAQPKNAAGVVGTDVKFTFKSRSSAAKYEWQISTDGGETWKKSGAEGNTTNTLTVPIKNGNYNGYMFRCKVTNGTWVEYTEAAMLSVKPAVTVQQKDVTDYYGNLVKLYVKASGTNPQYQWQVKSPASGKWGNSSQAGNNTNILKFTSVESLNGREFRCKITDNGYTVYSDVVKFTAVSNILTQPRNVSVKKGGTAKFTIKATGTEGEMSYYWQYSKDGGKTWTGIKVDGSLVTTDTLSLSNVTKNQSGWLFRCRVKNRSVMTYSDEAKLTVK
ncbi:MAG: immunoglobulin domain-containing protein [Eubacterium sp.]|nr:immunoglobulin domain-containing protein [Eubacterium sp.]